MTRRDGVFVDSSSLGRSFTEINITPLIDVMLVLLIFFVTAASRAATGLDAALPDHASEGPTRRILLLTIEAKGMTLDGRPIADLCELRGLFQDLSRAGSHMVLVRASDEVAYGLVVAAMDRARGANMELGIVWDEAGPPNPRESPTRVPQASHLPSFGGGPPRAY